MESICCYTIYLGVRIAAQKKDFVMSGIKSTFMKALTGAAIVAMPFMTSKNSLAKSSDFDLPDDPRTEFAANFGDVADGRDNPEPKKTTDGDQIKIDGADMRGSGKKLTDIQDGAGVMSMKGKLVLIAYMDKDDHQFEQDIEEAVIQNIKAGRRDIFLVYVDKIPGSNSSINGVAKGTLGRQVNDYDTEDLDVYIRRLYDESGYKMYPSTTASVTSDQDAPTVAGRQ